MNRTEPRESATIIPFRARGRLAASPRPEAIIEAELPLVDVAAWYHEAAVKEDERSGTH